MVGGGRRLWPIAGLVVVVATSAVVIGSVAVAPAGPMSDFVQTVTAVLTLAGGVALWLWTKGRWLIRSSLSDLDQASDALTHALLVQWEQEAVERRLRHPAPIPLRWTLSRRAVASPVVEAVGSGGQQRFRPLQGVATATVRRLKGGTLGELFNLYAGLDSGRLIILGGAGSGKSAAAILTLVDALRHRQALEKSARSVTPVPVLLTARSWDPRHQRLADWLVSQLESEYPFLRTVLNGHSIGRSLVTTGRVSVFLDGLDEIAAELRPSAVRVLDQQAGFRVVLISRTNELVDAVAAGPFHGAAAIELMPVNPAAATDYLLRCNVQPLPAQWQELIDHLRADTRSPLSRALDNPLALTLVRDTFPAATDLGALLESSFSRRDDVEGLLLDRILPVAYGQRSADLSYAYAYDQARRWLTAIASEMNRRGIRNLAWWQLQEWAPARLQTGVRVPGVEVDGTDRVSNIP